MILVHKLKLTSRIILYKRSVFPAITVLIAMSEKEWKPFSSFHHFQTHLYTNPPLSTFGSTLARLPVPNRSASQLGCRPDIWWSPVPTMVASSSIFFMPGGFQKRPRVADDAPPLSPPPHPPCVSLPFFQRNGANVQPCGQLTGRLGPYANLMTAETIVSSARCRKCVVRRCTYSNPDLCWIIDDQQGQGLLLVLPCGTLQGSALHVHS